MNAWYNIPYAQAPVEDLRWRAPQPVDDNGTVLSQVIDATQEGPACVQQLPAWSAGLLAPTIPEQPTGAEDCLILNVYKPANPVSDKLPVMIVIHGGGYTVGSAEFFTGQTSGPEYNSFPLVNQSDGNMIAVSIQYRLGVHGFLGSDEVMSDGTANAGLLDQRLALEWVQKHIGAFGGDECQVTIYGGSAGGGSVLAQMIMHGEEQNPPFRAGIAEYPWWEPYHDKPVLEAQYQQLLEAANCTDLPCLRNLDTDTFNRATQQAFVLGYAANSYDYGDFYFGPSVDGVVVPQLPSDAFVSGAFTKVPLLIDHDGYEGPLFTPQNLTTFAQADADLHTLWPAANQSFFDELYQLYPASAFNSTFFQYSTIFGDALIACTTRTVAKYVSAANLDVWKFIFRAGTELHGATAAYIFDDPAASPPSDYLGDWLREWIVGFVVQGDPNALQTGDARPVLPRYNDGEQILVVNQTDTAVDVDGNWDDTERCAFLERNGAVIRN